MKNWKCKIFGHKWTPVFIKAEYNGEVVRFIACQCERCNKGYDGAHKINQVGKNRRFGTYSEKYFDENKNEIIQQHEDVTIQLMLQ